MGEISPRHSHARCDMRHLCMGAETSVFPETADIETSSDAYAARFSGPTGAWMLQVQERIVVRLLSESSTKTVLDVGGGHGQLAGPLCRNGYAVTVLASSDSCKRRVAGLVDAGQCRFQVGNVVRMPFSDRAFDAVVCVRLLPHCGAWPALIAELCRVAAKAVVVDYPTTRSLNRIAPAFFGAKKQIEGNTRTWRMFSPAEIRNEFAKHGYQPEKQVGQFFFPMVLHRMLKCRPLSAAMEGVSRLTGLNAWLGSPVIVKMVKAEWH